MKILEEYLCSKNNDLNYCEDGIFVNKDFIAVIDGATSKGNLEWNGHTSGYFAKEILLNSLGKLPANCTGLEAFEILNNSLKLAYKNNYLIALNDMNERLQASIVIFSRAKNQIWSLGDCKFIINEDIYKNEKNIDILLAEVRSTFLKAEILSGKSLSELSEKDTGREFILPLLKRQSLFMNSNCKYNYSVLDGIAFDKNNVLINDVLPNSIIILASDGYPILKDTLVESEERLSFLLKKDPLCMDIYKSTKGLKVGNVSFDDRAYIKFKN